MSAFRGGGGGFHGFAARGIGGHAFAGHALSGHAFSSHAFSGHAFSGHALSAHAYGGHAFSGRGFAHRGVGHLTTGQGFAGHAGRFGIHNAPVAHGQFGAVGAVNQPGARGQFGHGLSAHGQFVHNRLAHNAFVAHNFHGLYNFNRAGFNRNAFGEGHRWNRWGGRFWGAGWNRWGYGWGGWAGPVFWPYLYGDVFSFAFWPNDYYDPFWAYGPDFLLASIFAPGPYFGADYGYAPDYAGGYAGGGAIYYGGPSAVAGGATAADRQALAETNAAAAESCSGLAPGVTDLPIAQIKQTVRPAGDQLTALDDLNAAAAKAGDVVRASCPTAIPLTPVARLDAAAGRLEAMIKAVDVVRGPLETFYGSLSDEQKQRFDAMGGSGRGAPGGDLAALCGRPTGDVTNLPVQRIEQVVQPTAQQQETFEALKQASHEAATQLQASCPSEVPKTPVARLDAVKTRMQAMVEAMNAIRPKLQAFYGSLSDDQKARFNTMGPPPNAASQSQQQGSNQ